MLLGGLIALVVGAGPLSRSGGRPMTFRSRSPPQSDCGASSGVCVFAPRFERKPPGRADASRAGRGQGLGGSRQGAPCLVLQRLGNHGCTCGFRVSFAGGSRDIRTSASFSLFPGSAARSCFCAASGSRSAFGGRRLECLVVNADGTENGRSPAGVTTGLDRGRPGGHLPSGRAGVPLRSGGSTRTLLFDGQRRWPASPTPGTSSWHPTSGSWPSRSADRSRGRPCTASTRTALGLHARTGLPDDLGARRRSVVWLEPGAAAGRG